MGMKNKKKFFQNLKSIYNRNRINIVHIDSGIVTDPKEIQEIFLKPFAHSSIYAEEEHLNLEFIQQRHVSYYNFSDANVKEGLRSIPHVVQK